MTFEKKINIMGSASLEEISLLYRLIKKDSTTQGKLTKKCVRVLVLLIRIHCELKFRTCFKILPLCTTFCGALCGEQQVLAGPLKECQCFSFRLFTFLSLPLLSRLDVLDRGKSERLGEKYHPNFTKAKVFNNSLIFLAKRTKTGILLIYGKVFNSENSLRSLMIFDSFTLVIAMKNVQGLGGDQEKTE